MNNVECIYLSQVNNMAYCHSCGYQNPEDAFYCNRCGTSLKSDREFEDKVRSFTDEVVKVGKEVGEKATELGKKVAKDAKAFAEEVSKKVAPKPIDCPKCSTRIYETDEYCWKCGDKRG
ncbi:MAG: zinc ribbon domain-containing protein [Thermoplasmata archaeon]|nr:MAG: zinc ribbon domain-containing protein [Thermoplasmata archaeon]